MLAPLLLSLICLVLLGLSIHLFFRGVRQTGIERVMDRLAQGQPQLELQKTRWSGLDRAFLRAGMGRPTERMGLWLLLWSLSILIGFAVAGWWGCWLCYCCRRWHCDCTSPGAINAVYGG